MPVDTYKDLSYETGNLNNWNGVEAANPAAQIIVQQAIVRANNHYACKFVERPGDVWSGNGTVRALVHNTTTNETVGNAYYWKLSVYIPASGGESMTHDNLLFELHNPSSLYTLSQGVLAPYAVMRRGANLTFRIVTGNLTVGSGYAHFESAINLLTSYPTDQWIDIIILIDQFSESSGTVKVWVDPTGTATFTEGSPAISRTGIPTTQFCNSANVHNVTLYTEDGLYTGASSISSTDTYYTIGAERFPKASGFAAVVAAFGGSVTSPPVPTVAPVISGSVVVGNTLAVSNGTWTNSPTSYAYQWRRDQQGSGSYVDIPGATASVYVLTNQDSGCHIKARVFASN